MQRDLTINSSIASISSSRTKKLSYDQKALEKSPILNRITAADKSAVGECLDKYGGLVWAMAKKFTASTEEAETAVEEIFLDIWKYAGRCESNGFDETTFIMLIAYRRLKKKRDEII